MAASWLKSLQCKSTTVIDAVHRPSPKPLLPSSSCKNTFQNLHDVIPTKHKPKPKPKPDPTKPRRSASVKPKPKPDPSSSPSNHPMRRRSLSEPFFPTVSELQHGHPSRNVVDIIFQTRWGPRGFPGSVETVLKIHNISRTISHFEEYRDLVRARARAGGNARCSADGNEMMRFRCLGPTSSVLTIGGDCGGFSWVGKGSGSISDSTYSGSGAAHNSSGGGKGRRAMLVCRVIAGRVSKRGQGGLLDGEFDSVSGENGELLVFDNRAVLPCFLVIYKL